jgi:primosomal protein N' (replication factor Y) (superfamily II helicase)
MTLDVLLPLKFDHPFTYNVPKDISVKVGDFVLVPFQNKDIIGSFGEKVAPSRAPLRLKI